MDFDEISPMAAAFAVILFALTFASMFLWDVGWDSVALWVRLGILIGAPFAGYMVVVKMED